MLSTDAFQSWSKKVVLVLHNTSRCDDEPYPNLLREMGGSGFPTMSYLDADGHLLQQLAFPTTLETCEQAWKELQVWKAMRAEVEAGTADAIKQVQLFVLELKMGNRPYAEMRQRRDALQINDAARKETEQPLIDLQFTEILRATPREQMAAAGAKFLAMFRQQQIPSSTKETPFWQAIFAHATEQQDVELFEEVMGFLRTNRGSDARLQRYLKMLEVQLDDLKAKKGG